MGSAFIHFGRRDCQRFEERLEDYLTGALPEGDERTQITAHLSDCPECRARVVEYTRIGEAFSSFRAAPLPERAGDWRSVRARLEAAAPESSRNVRRPVFGGRALATGLAAAGLGVFAVAFPMVRGSEATPVRAVPSPTWIESEAPPRKEKALNSMTRMMGYVTVGEKGNTLAAAQTTVGAPVGPIVPLVVEVESQQEVAAAQIEVRPQRSPDEHNYRYTVRLAEGKSRFLVYPSFGPYTDANSLNVCDVTLTAPGRKQTLRLHLNVSDRHAAAFACITNRFGAITPRRDWKGKQPVGRKPENIPAYFAPEFAPDRAIGYDSLRLLVLSPEAVTLSAPQWQAIREWVTAGGNLLLTSGELLDTPAAAELAPVRKAVRKAFGTTFAPIKDAVEMRTVVPREMGTDSTMLVQRRWGLGKVSFIAFDPSTEEFRSWDGCESFWENTRAIAGGVTVNLYQSAAHQRSIWSNSSSASEEDAFHLALPSVQHVLFLFLGYFVLVVPVTFAVLKHTRRLNLAWVSGPVLAAVFAGGIFLLTARLYFMPTARRTTGVLFLHSGERGGRFLGSSELFFPKAGRYDLPIANADLMETTLFPEERRRPLDSLADETNGAATATLSVGNLSFRRVHHEQSAALPGAVTVELQPDASGDLTGFIENNTGKLLLDAAFSQRIAEPVPDKNYTRNRMLLYRLGALPIGRTVVRIVKKNWMDYGHRASNEDYLDYQYGTPGREDSGSGYTLPQEITLLAHTSGEEFGPRIGRDFSGEHSVTIMVGFDTPKMGGKQ